MILFILLIHLDLAQKRHALSQGNLGKDPRKKHKVVIFNHNQFNPEPLEICNFDKYRYFGKTIHGSFQYRIRMSLFMERVHFILRFFLKFETFHHLDNDFNNYLPYCSSFSVINTAAPPGFWFGGNILGGGLVGGAGAEPPDARKFGKFPKDFLRKLQNMNYFRRFFKKLKNPVLNFRALDEKHNCLGNF